MLPASSSNILMSLDIETETKLQTKNFSMNPDHASRHKEVLFFADAHFLFLTAYAHCTHCQSPRAYAQTKDCQRVQFFSTLLSILNYTKI